MRDCVRERTGSFSEPSEGLGPRRVARAEEGLISVKHALNAFTACELPLLSDPFAQISLDGFADPPGSVQYNQELSENRAKSVRNYLHGLLGEQLTWGFSYEELKYLGRLDWRGHGEPPGSTNQKGSQALFDPRERRVDVNAGVRLGDQEERSLRWSLVRSKPFESK